MKDGSMRNNDSLTSFNNDLYSFLVMDNRGIGNSTQGVNTLRFTTKTLAQDSAKVLEHVGWTQSKSVHLLGIFGNLITDDD